MAYFSGGGVLVFIIYISIKMKVYFLRLRYMSYEDDLQLSYSACILYSYSNRLSKAYL